MTAFSSITDVAVTFLPHSVYPDAHVHLSTLYGGELELIDAVFTTPERTDLHDDVVNILKHHIIDQLVLPNALDTADTTRIPPLIMKGTFSVPTARTDGTRLTRKSLATAMQLAHDAGTSCVEITISTTHLVFHPTLGRSFLDWQYISDTAFDAPPATVPAPAAAAVDSTTNLVDALTVAFTTAIATLQASAYVPTQQSVPGPLSSPVTTFNVNGLLPDVKERYQRKLTNPVVLGTIVSTPFSSGFYWYIDGTDRLFCLMDPSFSFSLTHVRKI